jgi:hypothetical protein
VRHVISLTHVILHGFLSWFERVTYTKEPEKRIPTVLKMVCQVAVPFPTMNVREMLPAHCGGESKRERALGRPRLSTRRRLGSRRITHIHAYTHPPHSSLQQEAGQSGYSQYFRCGFRTSYE